MIPVNRTGTPQIGGRVFKHGCKSGVTAGTIVNRIISSRADTPFYYGTWAVVGEGSVRFSAGGDSGSGVTDESHALVGQVQAGFHNGRTYEVSYMCDIDSIFRDVQEMISGSKIELSLPNPTIFDSIISNVRYCFLSVGERLRREDDQDLSECWYLNGSRGRAESLC